MITEQSIAELVHGFEACTLAKEGFTHAAHLTMALVYVRGLPRAEATVAMRNGIRRFNAAVGGSPMAYHETITLAWIAVITRYLREHDRGQPLAELATALVATCGDKEYLETYYTPERLMSPEARAAWVAPDRAPIDEPSRVASTDAADEVSAA
jgi:hypothetical protein